MIQEKKELIVAIILVVVFAFILIGIYVWRLWSLTFATTPEAFSTFGDYIGGSCGALAGLVSIIFLYLTYSKQIEIFQKQKEDSYNNQFDQNFFHLLDSFRHVASEVDANDPSKYLSYFKVFRNKIEKDIDNICLKEDAFTDINALDTRLAINDVYKSQFVNNADKLGHYFRSLYHLLKYIKKYCKQNTKMYFDIVQSQMSTDELYITCIDGISNYGRKKMYPLLNESSFLENLAIDVNKNIQKIVYFYYPLTIRKNITGTRKNVILVAGTLGTKKSILASMIYAERLPVRMTSIQGMLIRSNKNFTNISGNIATLKKIIQKTIDPIDLYVINCDFCQLNKDGSNERLPLSVYEDFNPIEVIFLYTSLDNVKESMKAMKIETNDTKAQLYQDNEESCASDYADFKNVPFKRVDSSNILCAIDEIKSIIEKYN